MKVAGQTGGAGGRLGDETAVGGVRFRGIREGWLHGGQRLYRGEGSANTHFVYRDRLWQGADMMGLGVASFSHIGGTHFQNQHDFEPYLAALREGRLPVFRALTPTNEERLIRELVLQFKLGRISRNYFQRKFGDRRFGPVRGSAGGTAVLGSVAGGGRLAAFDPRGPAPSGPAGA